jgi:hypothetical protein
MNNKIKNWFYSLILNQQNLQFFLLVLFCAYLFYCTILLFWYRISWCDGYALGDWLINYEDGGFKRRGLSGSFFLWTSRMTGLYVGKLIFMFILFWYISFFGLLLYHLRKYRFSLWYWGLLFCPTILPFVINDFYAFGRKEIVFFLIGIIFLIGLEKNWTKSWWFISLVSCYIFVFTFFHEIFIFYLPYLIFMILIDYKKKSIKLEHNKIGVIILSSLIPTVAIFFFGGDINQGNTWITLKSYGLSPNVMNGIMTWPKEGFGPGEKNALTFAFAHNYKTYLIPLILTYILFVTYLKINSNKILTIKKFSVYFLCMLIYSSPLFFLSIDWGRWLNIHFVFIFLILSQLLPIYNNENKYLTKSMFTKNNIIIGSLTLVIILLNSFFYTMHHVDNGITFGENIFLTNLRDYFWIIRHLYKYICTFIFLF